MKIKLLRLLMVGTKFIIYGITLQCLFLSFMFAKDGLAQNIESVRKVQLEINLQNASLLETFRLIEKRTDFQFAFDKVDLDRNVRINLPQKKGTVADILMEISRQAKLKFRQVNNYINVHKALEKDPVAVEVVIEDISITGKVTSSEDGEGLPGVNVIIKDTSQGTVTDVNGEYKINVPSPETVLVFSSVGYQTEEITVGNKTAIDVTLVPDITALQEIVVVGYGTQRAEAVTGSVASISGDAIREIPSSNITQALQGRLPGVQLSQTDSKPGSSMQIRIRGTRSLNANNDPLIVLDGIPFAGSIADINPNDIKSLDILKDASATAIYGSRGANGVILITTNKGQKGQAPKISYNAYVGAKNIFAKYPMMDGPEFVKLRATANRYSNGTDESDDVNTDWQDLFYRTGITTSHDVGLSGGTEGGSYSFGLGYYLDQAVIPTQQYKRYSLRASIDQEVGKYFRFGLNSNNNYNINEGNQVGIGNVLSNTPISDPYNPDGSLKRVIHMGVDDAFVLTKSVVEGLEDQWLQEGRGYATFNGLYGEVKIPGVQGFKYRVNLGLDFIQDNTGSYTGEGVNSVNETTESTASVDSRYTYHWTVENLLSYDHTFNEKHDLNVVALYSAEQSQYNKSYVSAKDIPSDAFQYYNLGRAEGGITIDPGNDSRGNPYQDYQQWGLESLMARVMYAYNDRYFLSATVRSDGSSRLAPGHKWHTYPAVSAGWNISDESFMQNIPVIDRLKLRVGYGQTSNQAVSPYSTLGLLATRPYNFGDATYATGYYVSQLPNENLGWEYSKTWNYALDFALLKNRLSGTVEYYVTNTKDVLLGVTLPPTSGVNSYTANIGQTQNKGIEISLNGTILDDVNGWTWDAGLNISANHNELVALASGADRDEANAWFVGHNINAIYDYQRIGLWQAEDPYLDVLEKGGNVGMIKVKYTGDFNSDGTPTRQIGPDDRQVMDIEPNFEGGFNTRVAYRGFDLSVIGIFQSGGVLVSTLNGPSSYLNLMTGRRNNIKVDYWTPENTDAKYPDPSGVLSGDNPKYLSTESYFDGTFMKIRTITLGYDFSQGLIKDPNVNMRLYFAVQNPFVMFSDFTKETGLDPETNSYGDQNVATTGGAYQSRILTVGFNTPSTRNYVVGVNLTF